MNLPVSRVCVSFLFFCFDRLIDMYREYFGNDKVVALPLEMLSSEPQRFIEEICRLGGGTYVKLPTDRKANTAWGPVTYELLRWSNAIIRANRLRPRTGPVFTLRRRALNLVDKVVPRGFQTSIKEKQRQQIERRTSGMFDISNARSETMLELDLRKYGYSLKKSSEVCCVRCYRSGVVVFSMGICCCPFGLFSSISINISVEIQVSIFRLQTDFPFLVFHSLMAKLREFFISRGKVGCPMFG
ncbi:hypothetical protein [Jannaschia sp. 2305UL9-9]|uniref:hypothetical protein n=1 Tax=Jannaschia sp. 2305UL9-9 TaxID=3121638 RepID=UPI0035284AB9